MLTIPLSIVPKGRWVTVHAVVPIHTKDLIAQRLHDIGFTAGESIQVIACTPFQAGPLIIKIGTTRFALRQSEAARILVLQHDNGNK